MNREICDAKGLFENLNNMSHSITVENIAQTTKKPKIMFGNHSRQGDSWIGGPCHQQQRQHIPGYQGWI